MEWAESRGGLGGREGRFLDRINKINGIGEEGRGLAGVSHGGLKRGRQVGISKLTGFLGEAGEKRAFSSASF